jgi:glycerol-3-phosphate acyltransferase PlsY
MTIAAGNAVEVLVVAQGSPLQTAALVLLAVSAAYLLGAIPFGVVVCRPMGLDPRQVGSGRTGGTNVFRTAGMPAALITVTADILKGFVAVRIAAMLVPANTYGGVSAWAMSLAALAVIVGHNYSVFAGFRGGAGSTPNIGALLAYDPRVFVAAIVFSAVVLFGIRIASIASLALSGVIFLAISWRVIDGSSPPPALVYGAGQLLLLVWALRPNIARLRAGTERRIEFANRKREAGPESTG